MKRTLVIVAAVVGFAAAASAASLSVVSTNTGNVVTNLFTVGDTIVLRTTGDAQGGSDNAIHGELTYNGAITNTISGSQSPPMYVNLGFQFLGDGLSVSFDQNSGSANPSAPAVNPLVTTITLVATNAGVSSVRWGGELLDFFDIYISSGGFAAEPDLTSFTIVPAPEPTTAGLIGLGLIGLALGGRRRS